MDIDVIWLVNFTARCTTVQSTVLPSLSCTADIMWNAHWVYFTRTDCVSALVRWNTTQIIMFKSNEQQLRRNTSFASLVGHHHPSFWTAVEALRKDYALVVTQIPKKRQRRGQKQLQKRLRTLCQDFVEDRRTLEEFIIAVGHCIRFE